MLARFWKGRFVRIGKVLKHYRRIEDIGIRELAKEIGISYATLNRIERDVGDTEGRNLWKIMEWLFRQ